MDEKDTIAMWIYLELCDALFGWLHAVLWFVGSIFDETVVYIYSWMNKNNLFENCDLSLVQDDVDDWAIVSDNVNLALVVFTVED